jgi:uncharacterized membrane protein
MEVINKSGKINLILLYIFLPFYCLGSTMMEHFTVFDSWLFLSDIDFVKVHDQSGMRTLYVFIILLIVHFILSVFMLWNKTFHILKKYILLNIVCHTLIWVSTYFIQLPIQMALYNGKNTDMLNTLIQSDWIRVVPILILAFCSIKILNLTFIFNLKNQ